MLNNLVKANISSMYINSPENVQKAGKRAEIGEVREWADGKKYVKHTDGWVHYNEKSSKHTVVLSSGKTIPASEEHVAHAKKHLSPEVISPSTQSNRTPAYLMTLEEYQEKVVPLLKEYDKFIKKNEPYLAKQDYNGIGYYTYPEAVQAYKDGNNKGFTFRDRDLTYEKELTYEQLVNKRFGYRKTGNFGEYQPLATPEGLLEKKNEYISKLKQFFSDEEIESKIDRDEFKSNKRTIKRAIDNDTYKKLLENGTFTKTQLEEIASSVGVRIPAKSLTEDNLREVAFTKLYNSLPTINRESFVKMVGEMESSLKPLEDQVFEKETNRIYELVDKFSKSTSVEVKVIGRELPDYVKIFTSKIETRKVPPYTAYQFGRSWTKDTKEYVTDLQLKPDWKQTVDKGVREYVESLKSSLIISVMNNFTKISLPIKDIKQLYLKVGVKGFEGEYKFNFKNGSSFDFQTQGVGAGGYNIQVFHYRYLSHFTNATLSNGEKITGFSNILKNFSQN